MICSETFGRLLSGAINSIATYEGRTAPVVEEELGQRLHLAGKTMQRYKAGHLPPEHETVKVLDVEQETIFRAMEWLFRARRYAEVVRFGIGVMYFFYVRGLWDKWFEANMMRLEAGQGLQDFTEEVRALAYQVQMLSRQGRVKEAAEFRPKLEACIRGKNLPEETFFLVHRRVLPAVSHPAATRQAA